MKLAAQVSRQSESGALRLLSPGVGIWEAAPGGGAWLRGGDSLGRLRTLGRALELVVPEEVAGVVSERGARGAVGYGSLLVVLSAEAAQRAAAPAGGAPGSAADAPSALVLRALTGGRFWSRPAPEEAPFVAAGEVVELGATVGLLEVMKTFTPVLYEGRGLPARARVVRVLVGDGADVEADSPLLELERA